QIALAAPLKVLACVDLQALSRGCSVFIREIAYRTAGPTPRITTPRRAVPHVMQAHSGPLVFAIANFPRPPASHISTEGGSRMGRQIRVRAIKKEEPNVGLYVL